MAKFQFTKMESYYNIVEELIAKLVVEQQLVIKHIRQIIANTELAIEHTRLFKQVVR